MTYQDRPDQNIVAKNGTQFYLETLRQGCSSDFGFTKPTAISLSESDGGINASSTRFAPDLVHNLAKTQKITFSWGFAAKNRRNALSELAFPTLAARIGTCRSGFRQANGSILRWGFFIGQNKLNKFSADPSCQVCETALPSETPQGNTWTCPTCKTKYNIDDQGRFVSAETRPASTVSESESSFDQFGALDVDSLIADEEQRKQTEVEQQRKREELEKEKKRQELLKRAVEGPKQENNPPAKKTKRPKPETSTSSEAKVEFH